MRFCLTLIYCVALIACGGSSEEQAKSTDIINQSAQEQSVQPASEQSNSLSTLLSDTPAGEEFVFSQFREHNIVIEPESYDFSANTVFIKVYTEQGKLLFLGGVKGELNLSLYIENVVSNVFVDMFSTVAGDPQITMEINL
ncbi:hypothetical protein PA25_16580 [Pseudoalteromonas sp. A25]|uniref:hypothetical protein n=1 Tax=Pseudoalteromonas sp. A25 TaxID=116092 RepID=UPI0012604D57|nr:hypothetical protein [Pseudoalteromonas sp. A25]BBN81673.1 hypothetical protein PA25_16580 [Pseudoalteromonas sp. A25]